MFRTSLSENWSNIKQLFAWNLIKSLQIFVHFFLGQFQWHVLIRIQQLLNSFVSVWINITIVNRTYFFIFFWNHDFFKFWRILNFLALFEGFFSEHFHVFVSTRRTFILEWNVFYFGFDLRVTLLCFTFNVSPSWTVFTVTTNPIRIFHFHLAFQKNLLAIRTNPIILNSLKTMFAEQRLLVIKYDDL